MNRKHETVQTVAASVVETLVGNTSYVTTGLDRFVFGQSSEDRVGSRNKMLARQRAFRCGIG